MKRSLRAGLAMCVAVVGASPAAAYEVKTTSEGAPLRWPAIELTMNLALANGPADVSQEDAEAAAVGAINSWQETVNGTGVAMVVADVLDPVATSGDGVPSIRWAIEPGDEEIDAGRLAVTHIVYRVSDGAIQDADVIVNAVEFSWSVSVDECDDAYDLESAVSHELGHLLGMAHSFDESATMFASSGPCETGKRDLAPDDRAGIDYLYHQLPLPEVDAPLGGAEDDGGDDASDGEGDGEDDGGDDDADGRDVAPAYGCSVGQGSGQGDHGALPTALVALGLAALARRRSAAAARAGAGKGRRSGRAAWIALIALSAAAVPGRASASELRRLELVELGARAGRVVRGVVVSTRVAPTAELATDSVVAVTECLAGDCPDRVVVRRRGGERAGRGVWVDGEAELRSGDDVVLYLVTRGPVDRVVGGVQGVLTVVGRGAAAHAVRDLRGHRVKSGGGWGPGDVERIELGELRRSLAAGRATR